MSQKREKEETELKLPFHTPPITPHQIPPPRSPEIAGRRETSGALPEPSDPEPENRSLKKRSREVNRCSGSGCRKKLGLVGFRCRCGDEFCSEHRYSDRHVCCYDYKKAGKDAIQKENPVVRASKLLRI